MINLTLEQLSTIKVYPNMVLVKPTQGNEEITLPGGNKIFLDTSFNKEVHTPVTGIVINAPKELFYDTKIEMSNMPWRVVPEIKNGDYVVFNYLASMACLDEDLCRMFLCQGEPYFLVRYDEIFCVKRKMSERSLVDMLNCCEISIYEYLKTKENDMNMILPVNGYLLVEPIVEEEQEYFLAGRKLETPEFGTNNSATLGKIAHRSLELIQQYYDSNDLPDETIFSLNPGDLIVFDTACDLPVEYPLHSTVEGNKIYFRMQRRHVVAKL